MNKVGGIPSKISISHRDKRKQIHRDVVFVDNIPQSTKSVFKSACARKRESMRDAIIRMMRHYACHAGILPGQEAEQEQED